MDIQIFKEISSACGEILSANGFKCKTDEGVFSSDTQEFAVKFNEESSMYSLEFTDKANSADPVVLSSWLFDENNKGDKIVIKEDFCDSIAKKLGLKKLAGATNSVVMPTKSAAGQQNGVDSLTSKLLAIYPQFKEVYKENVATNGSFLYVDFFKSTVIPRMIEQTENTIANKKQLEKLFKTLGDVFYNCDRTTSDVLCGVIIAGTFVNRAEKFEECVPFLEDYPYFVTACREIVKEVNRNKKYKAVFEK